MKRQGSHLEPRLHVGCQPPARRHPTGPALRLRLPLQSPLWATASSLHLPLLPSFMPQLPKSHGERRLCYLSQGILTSVPPNSFVTLLKPACVVWGNSWHRGREKESLEVCILQVGKLRPIQEKKRTQGGDTLKVCHTPSALFLALSSLWSRVGTHAPAHRILRCSEKGLGSPEWSACWLPVLSRKELTYLREAFI